jgi:hypothetical protein
MFTIPNVALENAMACRIFRILKFDSTQSYIDAFAIEASAPGSLTHRSNRVTADPEMGGHVLVHLRTTQVTINVTKEVKRDSDTLDFPYKHDSP